MKEAPVIAGALASTICIITLSLLLAGIGGVILGPILWAIALASAGTSLIASSYGTYKYWYLGMW